MNLDVDMCLSSDRVVVREYYPLKEYHHTAVVLQTYMYLNCHWMISDHTMAIQMSVYASTDSLSGHLSPCCYFCPLHACK